MSSSRSLLSTMQMCSNGSDPPLHQPPYVQGSDLNISSMHTPPPTDEPDTARLDFSEGRTINPFRAARYDLSDRSYTVTSTRTCHNCEIPPWPQQQTVRAAGSCAESIEETIEFNAALTPEMPNNVAPESEPECHIHPKARKEPTCHRAVSMAENAGSRNTNPEASVMTVLDGGAQNLTFSRDGCDHLRLESLAKARLEAEMMLAELLSLKFFEAARTICERNGLLRILCRKHDEGHPFGKAVSESQATESAAEISAKIFPNSGSVPILQPSDREQSSGLPDNLLAHVDSSPRTPAGRGLKRRGSSLSSPIRSSQLRSPFGEALLRSDRTQPLTGGISRLSFATPPAFNLVSRSEAESPSPMESRRGRPDPGSPELDDDLMIMGSSKNKADTNIVPSIVDESHAVSFIEVGDQSGLFQAYQSCKDDGIHGDLTREEAISLSQLLETSAGLSKYKYVTGTVENLQEESPSSQKRRPIPIERLTESSSTRPRSWEPKSDETPPLATDPIIRKLIPYTRPWWRLTTSGNLRRILTKRFGKYEMGLVPTQSKHEGIIYIYILPGESNVVKIGVTQNSAKIRLNKWMEQCNHRTQLAYPVAEWEQQEVPHAYRVEALIHAELAATRLEEMECHCGIKHKEWFGEDLAHARKVVVKWSEWMRKHPYHEVKPLEWELKEEHRSNLADLSCPLPKDEREAAASPRQPQSPPSPHVNETSSQIGLPRLATTPTEVIVID